MSYCFCFYRVTKFPFSIIYSNFFGTTVNRTISDGDEAADGQRKHAIEFLHQIVAFPTAVFKNGRHHPIADGRITVKEITVPLHEYAAATVLE